MKKTIAVLSLSVLLITVMSSCKKVITSLFPGIDVKVPDIELTIPPIIFVPSAEVSLASFTTSYNLDSVIREKTNNIFNINDVASIKIKQATISLQNGDNMNNLSNFENARLTIASNSNNIEQSLLSINFPADAANSITVNPASSPDLKSYLNGNQFTYNMYGTLRRPTTKSLKMVVSFTIRVE